jgi:hypothetical protein
VKVLAKIKRRNNGDDLPRRGHLVEMDLFDRERNPLEFPEATTGVATAKHWARNLNPDTSAAPWSGSDTTIVVPWGAADGEFVETTSGRRIRLLESGVYLVNFEASFYIYDTPTDPVFAGAMIAYYEPGHAGGDYPSRLAGDSGKDSPPGNVRSYSVNAIVVVGDTPKEIITVVHTDGTFIPRPQQGNYDWPLAPLRLQVVKLP